MSLEEASSFLCFLFEKENEEKAWQHWLSLGPWAQQEISWVSIKESLKTPKPRQKEDEEILDDVKNILQAFRREAEINGNI